MGSERTPELVVREIKRKTRRCASGHPGCLMAEGPVMNDQLPPLYVTEGVIWEYKHLARDLASGKMPTEDELNSLGKEGWELVGVVREQDTVHLYFKRPKN